MAKEAISYPLRIYDKKLWNRVLQKAKNNKETNGSINAEIAIALNNHAPQKKMEPKTR